MKGDGFPNANNEYGLKIKERKPPCWLNDLAVRYKERKRQQQEAVQSPVTALWTC